MLEQPHSITPKNTAIKNRNSNFLKQIQLFSIDLELELEKLKPKN